MHILLLIGLAGQPTGDGGLRLDSRDLVLKGGTRGPAVVPGDAAASLLLKAVRHEGALKMPPTGKSAHGEALRVGRQANRRFRTAVSDGATRRKWINRSPGYCTA